MSRTRLGAFTAFLLLTASLSPLAASAQPYDDSSDSDTEAAHGGNASAAARLQVRINELEEQVRKLQGAMEQTSFANRQLTTKMEKLKGDIEYRLNALEKNPGAAAPAAASTPTPQIDTSSDDAQDSQPNKYSPSTTQNLNTKQPAPAKVTQDAPPASVQNFPSSHEHYSYAFKLMNEAKYAEAGSAFTAFTQRYPKDPLIGNAYYWLGETNYVQKDYVKAADNFRQGYEAMPAGPKAADNLLKLAASLDNLGKDKESCVVLKQVNTKFSKGSGSVKSRVEQEMNRMDCR